MNATVQKLVGRLIVLVMFLSVICLVPRVAHAGQGFEFAAQRTSGIAAAMHPLHGALGTGREITGEVHVAHASPAEPPKQGITTRKSFHRRIAREMRSRARLQAHGLGQSVMRRRERDTTPRHWVKAGRKRPDRGAARDCTLHWPRPLVQATNGRWGRPIATLDWKVRLRDRETSSAPVRRKLANSP